MGSEDTTRDTPKRKRIFFLRGGFWFALILTVFALAIVGGIAGLMVYRHLDDYSQPYRERAAEYDLELINEIEHPSLIVDRNGKEIGRFFVQNRSVISIDEVPEIFIDVRDAQAVGTLARPTAARVVAIELPELHELAIAKIPRC